MEHHYWWLKFGGMKGEIESMTEVAQDEALSTNILREIFESIN
jgi:hypothetical protein